MTYKPSFKEFFWLLRYGTIGACFVWPMEFGAGVEWYDGPIYYVFCGFFNVAVYIE